MSTFVETEPTGMSLTQEAANLLFLMEMIDFFVNDGKLECVDSGQWEWLESGIKRVIYSLTIKMKGCRDQLDQVRSDIHALLETQESWTPKTLIALDNSRIYVEARSFLNEISTMASKLDVSDEDLICAIDNFDNSIGVYLGNVAEYAKEMTSSIYDNGSV